MISFIDSHAHLADPAFDVDRGAVLERARAAGAERIIVIGESLAAADRAARLATAAPALLSWTAGVHPHDAATFDDTADPARIRAHIEAGAVAVGECGLDYHYENSPPDAQRSAFAAQLELAAELHRPVVVHSREAEEDTGAMVREAGIAGVRGVMHCFTGSPALAEIALAAGWYISFSGIITFRKWMDDSLLRSVPEERLLVESDAPYLAPVPHRGRRNEPAWVAHTVARLADARAADAEALGHRVAANARALFGLAGPSLPR